MSSNFCAKSCKLMGLTGGVLREGVGGATTADDVEDVREEEDSSSVEGVVGVAVRVGVGGAVDWGVIAGEDDLREGMWCVVRIGLEIGVPCERKRGKDNPEAEVRIGRGGRALVIEDREGDFLGELCMRRGGEEVGDSSSSSAKIGEGERETSYLRRGEGVRAAPSWMSSLLSFISFVSFGASFESLVWLLLLVLLLLLFSPASLVIGEGSIQARVVLRFGRLRGVGWLARSRYELNLLESPVGEISFSTSFISTSILRACACACA